MERLSGDQVGDPTPCGIQVNWRASPPSVGISQSCGLPVLARFSRGASFGSASPSRSEMKASQRPSGDQAGLCALATVLVKQRASPPCVGITQIEEW